MPPDEPCSVDLPFRAFRFFWRLFAVPSPPGASFLRGESSPHGTRGQDSKAGQRGNASAGAPESSGSGGGGFGTEDGGPYGHEASAARRVDELAFLVAAVLSHDLVEIAG